MDPNKAILAIKNQALDLMILETRSQVPATISQAPAARSQIGDLKNPVTLATKNQAPDMEILATL
jgi:hypothetical protein